MKIKKLEVENFKAIQNVQMTFDGCHAIVTGQNGAGKSSALRGLIDRPAYEGGGIKYELIEK